jgi:Tol biopolymer transport system component
VIFIRDRTLMAQRLDIRRLALSGDAFPVSEQRLGATTAAPFSISSNGSLAYHVGRPSTDSQLVWFDRNGKEIGLAGPKGHYQNPELSPDGRHVAFGRGEPPNIWVRNIQNGIDTQFSFHRARDFTPIWSRNGQTIAFYSERDQKVGTGTIYTRPFGTLGEDKRLLKSEVSMGPADWSHDGHYLAYTSADDVWVLRDPLSDNPKPQRVTQTAFTESNPRISPNGRWIAYESNQSGRRLDVHIQSFRQPGIQQQVSNGGGLQPRWAPDSKELFYLTPDFTTVMAVGIKTSGTSLDLEASVSLFQVPIHPGGLGRSYSVSADGRFLINVAVADQEPAPISVVHNWAASLKK